MAERCLHLAVLISGGGRTLQNLLRLINSGKLQNVSIDLVISSSAKAGGLQYAEEANIPTLIIPSRKEQAAEDYSEAHFSVFREQKIELVVMAGFVKHLLIPDDFENRVVNIHPSLIPNFCGQGFYGSKVHQAVIDAGAKQSGCTVHFVDNQYDHGPIILQRAVDVTPDDTPETLASRVFEAECIVYPEAIQQIVNRQVKSTTTK